MHTGLLLPGGMEKLLGGVRRKKFFLRTDGPEILSIEFAREGIGGVVQGQKERARSK